MAEENGNLGQGEVSVSNGLSHLTHMLAGLPGAEKILTDTAKEAVETGLITVSNNQEAVEDVGDDDQNAEEGDVKADILPVKKVDKKSEKIANQEPEEEGGEEDQEDISEEDENPLLRSLKGNGKDKKNEIPFKNFDEIKNHAKKKFGIEIKSEKDFSKFFNSAEQWRQDSQKVTELEDKMERVDGLFDSMPKALLDSVTAFFNGDGDWDKHISDKPKFDFNKSAEKQDKKSLVNHYFPNKFTDADWSLETTHPGLDIAIEAAKNQYNSDKRELENQSATMTRQSQQRLELKKSSVASSLKNLNSSFPNLDNSVKKQIQKTLESGDINSLFFDKNGGFKDDAAEKLLLVLHGKGTIKSMMKLSEKRAETKTNEEILTRGNDKPKPSKGGVSPKQVVNANVQKAIDALVGGLNVKKTY